MRFTTRIAATKRPTSRMLTTTRIRHQSRSWFSILLLVMIMLSVLQCTHIHAHDAGDDDEFVRQVLEEEQEHYGDDHHNPNDEYSQQARLEAEAFQKAEEERIERERAEQIRLQRELEFEAELARMNQEQQKAAKKQKKKDARIVHQVLKAYRKGRLYAVLGIRDWNIHVGPVTLKRTDASDIRRAYRTRAREIHPDRNRDGRAQEAFIAVENAASILSDEQQREVYDEEVRLARKQRRDEVKQTANAVKNTIGKYLNRGTWIFRRIFGPFATPIFILGCLMI